MGPDARKRPAVNKAALPQPPQSAVGDIFVAANETHELGGTGETVAQHRIEEVKVAVGDRAALGRFGSDEF